MPAPALDLAITLAMACAGGLVASAIVPSAPRMWHLASAFPLGLGLTTWSVFILSRFDAPISLCTVGGAVAGVAGTGVFALWARRRSMAVSYRGPERLGVGASPRRASWLPWLVGLVGLSALIGISVGRAYSTWDAIAVSSVKGYGIALEGTIDAGARWGAAGLSYPLNIPLGIAIYRLLSGDVLPGSKVIFPLFAASAACCGLAYWMDADVGRRLRWAGVAYLACVPTVFLHATIGYTNLPMTAYLVLGFLWLLRGVDREQREDQALGSLLLGLAAWTRVEGILYAGLLGVCALAALRVTGRGKASLPHLLLPGAAVALPWLLFFVSSGGGDSPAVASVSRLARAVSGGQFQLGSVAVILRYLAKTPLNLTAWGPSFLVSGLLILGALPRLRVRRRTVELGLVLAAAATLFMTAAVFYVGSFTAPDLVGWVYRSFDRELLPTSLLASLLAIHAAARLIDPAATRGETAAT